ncbi:uncharacterized protein LOC126992183 [Eriocheir sinensis]|uniref:uncharacterized protein LOC126992183 n=1 Tax=Eriocheir sinensis TaxID=95602 RepID=UPI0021CA85F8|nr:uncharacterized protein LOC126992183 [Eriocheir sinensis]
MMPHFEDVAIIPNPGERAEAMRQLINRLPTANRLLLQYMFKHMGHIIARVVPIRRHDSPTGHLYSKSKSKTASPPRPLSPPQSSLHGLLQGLRWSGSPQCCPSQCQGSATPVSCGAMPGLRAPLAYTTKRRRGGGGGRRRRGTQEEPIDTTKRRRGGGGGRRRRGTQEEPIDTTKRRRGGGGGRRRRGTQEEPIDTTKRRRGGGGRRRRRGTQEEPIECAVCHRQTKTPEMSVQPFNSAEGKKSC